MAEPKLAHRHYVIATPNGLFLTQQGWVRDPQEAMHPEDIPAETPQEGLAALETLAASLRQYGADCQVSCVPL